jgi:hypothetical protein
MKYYCKHCKKTVSRNSKKAWVKSYCEEYGKTVHLIRMQNSKAKISNPKQKPKTNFISSRKFKMQIPKHSELYDYLIDYK